METVTHNLSTHCFQIINELGTAQLDYVLLNKQSINFTHTYVPFKMRGKGMAELLVKAGLDWANDKQLQVSTSCWYVEKYMAEHCQ